MQREAHAAGAVDALVAMALLTKHIGGRRRRRGLGAGPDIGRGWAEEEAVCPCGC